MQTQRIGFDGIIESEWHSLLQRSVVDTIFQTHMWSKTWWDVFQNGLEQHLVTVHDDGELIAIFPLYTASDISQDGDKKIARLMGGLDVTDYQAPIVVSGREQESFDALVGYAKQQGWHEIELNHIPEVGGQVPYASSKYPGRPQLNGGGEVEYIQAVDLGSITAYEDYMKSLRGKDRHEMERKIRRLEERNHSYHTINSMEEVEAGIRELVELMEFDPRKKAFFEEDSRRRDFFYGVAKAATEKGWLRLSLLDIDCVARAGLLCFDYWTRVGNHRFRELAAYNSGLNIKWLEANKNLGLNVALFLEAIRHAVENGFSIFNFLRGNEPYKGGYVAQPANLYSVRVQLQS